MSEQITTAPAVMHKGGNLTRQRQCPAWCTETGYHEQDARDTGDAARVEHAADVAAGWFPEVRRTRDLPAPSRPDQGEWSVSVLQVEHRDQDGWLEDAVVDLRLSGPDGSNEARVPLLPGEARELAAALVAAADRMMLRDIR